MNLELTILDEQSFLSDGKWLQLNTQAWCGTSIWHLVCGRLKVAEFCISTTIVEYNSCHMKLIHFITKTKNHSIMWHTWRKQYIRPFYAMFNEPTRLTNPEIWTLPDLLSNNHALTSSVIYGHCNIEDTWCKSLFKGAPCYNAVFIYRISIHFELGSVYYQYVLCIAN